MYVSHFNSFLQGGASTAAQQLHHALLNNGVQSRFQYSAGQTLTDQNGDADQRSEYYPTTWPGGGMFTDAADTIRFRLHRERFKRATRRGVKGAEIFTSPHGKPSTTWPPVDHPAAGQDTDQRHIIHLHWISKFIDFTSFFGSLADDQPVVWTLHDMNALTGGCHFSGGCQRFRIGCGNCPQVKRPDHKDVSFRSFETKRRALQHINLHVVAPSQWLLDLAQASPLISGARSFTRIPYGMPTDSLYPVDTHFAREALGIESDAFLFGFGAMNLDSRRKGTAELLLALRSVGSKTKVRCLVFGSGDLATDSPDLPEMIHVGQIQDERTRRLIYSAADAFVLPSTEDNLPLTGLESMACGTPVIGFNAGGIPDYVIPGRTGMLAANGNAEQLGERMRSAAADPERMKSMGVQARQLIVDRFEANRQALVYLDLYRSLSDVAERSGRRAA